MEPESRFLHEMRHFHSDAVVRLENLQEGQRRLEGPSSQATREACVRDEEFEAAVAEAFSERERIEGSLWRMRERSYGYCMACGQPIGASFLYDYPFAVNCRNCVEDFPIQYLKKIGLQHHRVFEKVERMRARLGDLISRLGEGRAAAERAVICATLIRDFDWVIHAHFALEERGGYLHEALAEAPRFSRKALDLERQHRRLSEASRELVELSSEAEDSHEGWKRVCELFEMFAVDLRAHEEAENEIASSALLEDLGGGG